MAVSEYSTPGTNPLTECGMDTDTGRTDRCVGRNRGRFLQRELFGWRLEQKLCVTGLKERRGEKPPWKRSLFLFSLSLFFTDSCFICSSIKVRWSAERRRAPTALRWREPKWSRHIWETLRDLADLGWRLSQRLRRQPGGSGREWKAVPISKPAIPRSHPAKQPVSIWNEHPRLRFCTPPSWELHDRPLTKTRHFLRLIASNIQQGLLFFSSSMITFFF